MAVRPAALACIAVLLLAAVDASALGTSGRLDPLYVSLRDRRDSAEDPADRKARRALGRGLRALRRRAGRADHAGDLRALSRAARSLERGLIEEADLRLPLLDAIAAYRLDLVAARDELAALPAPTARDARLLARADRALARADAAPTLASELRRLAGAARALAGGLTTEAADEAAWVIREMTLAPPGQGLDLDGDGTVDNVLGGVGAIMALIDPDFDVDAFIADQLDGRKTVLVELWDVDDWDDDPVAFAGIMWGRDLDRDRGDNFSGDEVFDASGYVRGDGHPILRQEAVVTSGRAYEVEYTGERVDLGIFVLPAKATVRVVGTAGPDTHTGTLAFGVPMMSVVGLLRSMGYPVPPGARNLLMALSDLDLDGDGEKESASGAFLFDAVPARLR